MVTRAKRFGAAAVRTPSIVTVARVSGTPVSRACISISVTPQDDTPARNASLFVSASVWGRDYESSRTRAPCAELSARPMMPLLVDSTVSIFSSLMCAPPCPQGYRDQTTPAGPSAAAAASNQYGLKRVA